MIKNILRKIPFITYFLIRKHNNISVPKFSHISFEVHGRNNTIFISSSTKISKASIKVYGNNTTINIGNNNYFADAQFWIEDDGSSIIVGDNNNFCGKVDISAIEGGTIQFKNDSLISRNVSIVNGDSHSIMSLDGKRINPSTFLIIGNHNWIGKNVNILKRGSIGNDCVIGANSLVTKDFSSHSNCVIAGFPAKIIKENVVWSGSRIG